ncbi:MAG: hypothetical protein H7841_08345 [Magnetospirillum sp. WYHS-4]
MARRVPQAYLDLVEAVGAETANALVAGFRGTRVYVPRADNLTADHDLVRRLGWDRAGRIARAFTGEHLDVPSMSVQSRAALVVELSRTKGMKHAAIALAVGLSQRRVVAILRQNPDTSQGDLFGQ